MAEGAMERVVDILRAELTATSSSSTLRLTLFRVEAQSSKCGFRNRSLCSAGVSRGRQQRSLHLTNLYGSNAPKVFALAHSIEQAPGLSLADTLSLHYAMRNELASAQLTSCFAGQIHMLFMRDSLDAIVEPCSG